MDLVRAETALDKAYRYVREAEEHISRIKQVITELQGLGESTADLDHELSHAYDWLALAHIYLEYQQSEARSNDHSGVR